MAKLPTDLADLRELKAELVALVAYWTPIVEELRHGAPLRDYPAEPVAVSNHYIPPPPLIAFNHDATAGRIAFTNASARLHAIRLLLDDAQKAVGAGATRRLTPQEERDAWIYDQYVNHTDVPVEKIALGTNREGWDPVERTGVIFCVDRHHRKTLGRTDAPPRRGRISRSL